MINSFIANSDIVLKLHFDTEATWLIKQRIWEHNKGIYSFEANSEMVLMLQFGTEAAWLM